MIDLLKYIGKRGAKSRLKMDSSQQNVLMLSISRSGSFEEVKKEFNMLYDSLVFPMWTTFYKKYVPPLNKEDLKDVFQDAWIKVLDSRTKYDPQNNAFNWIFVIKQNMIIDKIRMLRRRGAKVISENENEELSEAVFNVADDNRLIDEQVISDETINIISSEIEAIKDDTEREILTRRVVLGQKLEQISAELNIPLTTVYKKIKKCIEHLKPRIAYLINN